MEVENRNDITEEIKARVRGEIQMRRAAREGNKLQEYYAGFSKQLEKSQNKWAITAGDKVAATPIITCGYYIMKEACNEYTRTRGESTQKFYTQSKMKQRWR